jgi:Co/Zn/Cd efflux system component
MRIQGPEKPHRLRDVVASVLAAALGVQSDKNRARDSQYGSPRHFIIGGIIGTLVFVAAVYLAVRLVLRIAGV